MTSIALVCLLCFNVIELEVIIIGSCCDDFFTLRILSLCILNALNKLATLRLHHLITVLFFKTFTKFNKFPFALSCLIWQILETSICLVIKC